MKRTFILLTGSAFVALILLIAALTANSIYQLARIQKHMDAIVEQHNRKIDTVTRTQIATHARADRLLRMSIENDPFVRDQLFLEFNRAGFMVGSGRQELQKLGLTPEERKLFDAQGALIERIVPMQEKVVEFLGNEQIEDARSTLISEGIPMQENLNEMLVDLRGEFQKANSQALKQARLDYRGSLLITLLFGISATVLGMALAWFSLRRMSNNAREIEQQMTALESSRASLELEATHDAMTGLANRKLFYDRLKQAMLQAKRYNRKVGVLFVDLDNFKTVNDLYGHHVGDALLAEVAQRLKDCVRESDSVARAGGDEFLILLGSLSRRDDCDTTIDKILDAMERKAHLFGTEILISASIGCAVYPDDGVTEDELIRVADAAMYQVKTGHARTHQLS